MADRMHPGRQRRPHTGRVVVLLFAAAALLAGGCGGAAGRQNVGSLVFKEHEGSYLVGMIAARKSRTGVLGFVGGMDIPLIHRFEVGFEEGARAVNPRVTVIPNYVGVTDAAWNNPGKGKELAVAQIGKGADVLFAAAGNSGLGAFDAAEQHGIYIIAVESNQN